MKKHIIKSLIIGLLILPLHLWAQDIHDVLKKVQDAYSNLNEMEVKMKIDAYADESTGKPYFTQNAEIIKKGELFYYKTGALEGLLNEKYTFWVDHSTKKINGTLKGKSKKPKGFKNFSPDIDKVLESYEKLEFAGNKGTLKHYKITKKEGAIKQIELFINDRFLVEKMIYRYNEEMVGSKSWVNIQFEKFDTKTQANFSTFNESRFVENNNGQFTANDQYKNYKVFFDAK